MRVFKINLDYRKPQECSPSISGSVYDIYTRELLVGSLVELLNQNNNPIDETIADQKGNFIFQREITTVKIDIKLESLMV